MKKYTPFLIAMLLGFLPQFMVGQALPECEVQLNISIGSVCGTNSINISGTFGDTISQVNISHSGSGNFSDFSQENGDFEFNYNPSTDDIEETVIITVITDTMGNNCNPDTAIFTLVVNPNPNAVASSTGPYCEGVTIQLNASGGNTYEWRTPDDITLSGNNPTRQNATTNMGGTYTVTVTDSNGCSSTATTNVEVNPNPSVSASNEGPYCEGVTIQLNASGGNTYEWRTPDDITLSGNNPTRQNAITNMGGTYTVTVTDSNGCSSTATTNVEVNPLPEFSLTTDLSNGADDPVTDFCEGDSITLSSDFSGNDIEYNWSDASSLSQITVDQTGTYTLTITDDNECKFTNSIDVTQRARPRISSFNIIDNSGDMNDNAFCIGDPDDNWRINLEIVLDVGNESNSNHISTIENIQILDGQSKVYDGDKAENSIYTIGLPSSNGSYTAKISTNYECINDQSPELSFEAIKIPEPDFRPKEVVLGYQISFNSQTSYDSSNNVENRNYDWTLTTSSSGEVKGQGTPVNFIIPKEDFDYTMNLEVEDTRGCKNNIIEDLKVVSECEDVGFRFRRGNNDIKFGINEDRQTPQFCENESIIFSFNPQRNFGADNINVEGTITITGADLDTSSLTGPQGISVIGNIINVDTVVSNSLINDFSIILIPNSDTIVIESMFKTDCGDGGTDISGTSVRNLHPKRQLTQNSELVICDFNNQYQIASLLNDIDGWNYNFSIQQGGGLFDIEEDSVRPGGNETKDQVFQVRFNGITDNNSCPVDSATFTYTLRAVPKIETNSIVTSFCEGNDAFLNYDSIVVSTDTSINYVIQVIDSSGDSLTTLSRGESFNLRNGQFSWNQDYQLLAIRDDDYSACSTEAITLTFGSTAIPSYTFDPVETAVCRGQWKQFVMTNDSIAWDSVFIADGNGNAELLYNRNDYGLISFGVRVNDNMGSLSIRLEGVRKDNTGSRDDDCRVNETITLAINNTAPYGEEELPMTLVQRGDEQMLQLFLPEIEDLLGTFCYRWGLHTHDNPRDSIILQDSSRLPYHLFSELYNEEYLYFVELGDSECNFDCAGRYYLGGTREALSGSRSNVTLGIYGSTPVKLEVFPNPAESTFQIRVQNAVEDYRVEIFDISGKLVLQVPFIDATALRSGHHVQSILSNGMYIICLTGKRGDILQQKLIIQSY